MIYFKIQELSKSETAEKNGIDNTPGITEIFNMVSLVDNVLDPLRIEVGEPIIVTSGYRCDALNKLVGGADNSQHKYGQAADITLQDKTRNKLLYDKLLDHYKFDQLIWEKGTDEYPDWVHVSFSGNNRHQVLRIK